MMKKGDGNRPPGSAAALVLILTALMLSFPPEGDLSCQEAEKNKTSLQHEVTVTLKLIQVTVTDKKGNPVSDLRGDEFVLYDNGKRQNLTEFELHVVKLPAPQEAPAEEQVVSTPTAPSRLLNRKIFLFFDFAQTDWRGARKAAEAARHFVDTRLLPTDEVGVISCSAQRILEIQEFLTTDHQRILRILESFGLRSAAESGLDAEERYAQSLKEGAIPDARAEPTTSYQSGRAPKMPRTDLESVERWIAQSFMWNLRTFAQALRYLPGQKILFLFSYGIPGRLINQEPPSRSERSSMDIASTEGRHGMNMDLRRAYTDLCRDLATSNISIYPINTQGITAASEMKTGAATLREMAEITGGRYFGNIHFVERHLEEVQLLTGTFYVLGYPINETWDGKYHKIKVEVTRPGCTVRAQGGYFNPKPFSEFSDLEKLIHLVDLALAEKPLSQVPVRFAMRATPMSSQPVDNLSLVAAVDLDELAEVGGKKFEIHYLVFNPADEIICSRRVETTLEKPGSGNAFLFEMLSLPPGHYKCRIVLRNAETGRAAVSAAEVDLQAMLKKAADYCQKLENSALYFVCREEIQETIDPTLDINPSRTTGFDWAWVPRGDLIITRGIRKIKHTYIYDYQCIRAGRAIRETRTLLKEDGKAKHEPNATLKTSVVVFGTVLMGPVGLFGERFQPDYEYSVVGQDKIGKQPVVIIDAKPKLGAPRTGNLYGKAWIDPVTADILRIEWSETRVGHYDIFEKRGALYKRTPRLTIRSEFSTEKNGIRFPSHLVVEEAYLSESGRAFNRSKTDVTYKDFKFFTVEVEISN